MNSFKLSSKICWIADCETPDFLLLQPCGRNAISSLKQEQTLLQSSGKQFVFCAVELENWNRELSPWQAEPVWGKESFDGNASDTLFFFLKDLIPYLQSNWNGKAIKVFLGGYSLAGLFSLWSAYQSNTFDGIAAVSPSVWFQGWHAYSLKNQIQTRAVYLSLGTTEQKTRNPILKTVKEQILRQEDQLQKQSIPTILEWNPGNHFQNPEDRMAKGFIWLMQGGKESSYRGRKKSDENN